MQTDMPRQLREWQQIFIDDYVTSDAKKSLLVAAPGTGKTITTLSAAKKQLDNGRITSVVVISDRNILQDQWRHVGREIGLGLSDSLPGSESGAAITFQSLNNHKKLKELSEFTKHRSSLIVFDEACRYINRAEEISEIASYENSDNKFLYLSSFPIKDRDFDWKHSMGLGREFLFQPEIIQIPEAKIEISRYSPSLGLLNEFFTRTLTLDDLSWRQFEILISQLLESDGYSIELMQGTKDGGVDIVAVKDMKEAGLYKALWQAKKYKISSKIGISTIRELADVRNELGASKGILVTSSFLTRGALDRVYRDRFTLGKVDRDDISAWINRKLFE
ncbi:restriction endonuclease [Stutzerimonas stutzeri]|uniref:Helicase ATP-binding domain-containing protein n=1 Tax=Stutzerimonas stutzeri TaxID=316 RepID=A0A172WLJ2_STUST|nr:restriction endonuclease [Stutzerimonas stutzeri]ANF24196.1 hypothetical protein PS273GM_03055 [Stutzerimonas stutzeri]